MCKSLAFIVLICEQLTVQVAVCFVVRLCVVGCAGVAAGWQPGGEGVYEPVKCTCAYLIVHLSWCKFMVPPCLLWSVRLLFASILGRLQLSWWGPEMGMTKCSNLRSDFVIWFTSDPNLYLYDEYAL